MKTYYFFPLGWGNQSDKSQIESILLSVDEIYYYPERLAKTNPERCCKFWKGHFLYEDKETILASQAND